MFLIQTSLRGKKAALAAGPKILPQRPAREKAKAAIKAMTRRKASADDPLLAETAPEDIGNEAPPEA